MSNFAEHKLGDVARVTWGDTNTTKASYKESGFLAFSAAGPDGFLDHYDYECDGIVLSAIGAKCGGTWFASGRWSCIKNTIVITKPTDTVDIRYLYYVTSDPAIWPKRGAAQPFISQTDARGVSVKLPPLPTQQRIAAILSAYDDLIENNTRRIAILEEMARRLYEEWFVHFRFPGHEEVAFKESELGRIPQDWEAVEVKSMVHRRKNGKVYKQGDAIQEGSVIIIDQSTSELLGFHSNTPDHEACPAKPMIIFGDHTCKMQIMVAPFSLGPNTIAFTRSTGHSVYYLFSLVRGLIKTQEYKRHWGDFMKKRVAQAPVNLALEYGTSVEPMFRLVELLRTKNRNLRIQRDLLLPKLVSGEIDVSDLPLPDEASSEAA